VKVHGEGFINPAKHVVCGMSFKIRAFKGCVNILTKKGSNWVRVYRLDVLNGDVFRRVRDYVHEHGKPKAMRVYGSRHYTVFYEMDATTDLLRELLGEDVVNRLLQGT